MLRVFEILSWEQWEIFEESQVWEWYNQIGVLQRMLPSFLWFHLSQHKTRSQAFLAWSITSSLLLSPLKSLLHTVTKQTEENQQAQALEIWCYHSRFKSFNDFPMPPGYNPNPLTGVPRFRVPVCLSILFSHHLPSHMLQVHWTSFIYSNEPCCLTQTFLLSMPRHRSCPAHLGRPMQASLL